MADMARDGLLVAELAARRARRRAANWELLSHFRFTQTASLDLIAQWRGEASPLLALLVPVLPLIFGRRESRADRLRRAGRRLAYSLGVRPGRRPAKGVKARPSS